MGRKDNHLFRLNYRTLCTVLACVEKEAFMVISLNFNSLDCFSVFLYVQRKKTVTQRMGNFCFCRMTRGLEIKSFFVVTNRAMKSEIFR